MSLIAGLHLGNFALIASDKREMTINGDTLVFDHDEAEKIINAGLGYISGSGIVELLNSVKVALTNTEITHTDEILDIIKSARECFRLMHYTNLEWAEKQIKKTGWNFTYITEENGQPTVRVAIVHGSWNDDEVRLLHKGVAKILIPIDGTDLETQQLSDYLNENLKTTDEIPNLVDNISYHIPILINLFKSAAKICESVSESFHVAVHVNDGKMMISSEICASTVNVQLLTNIT